MTYWTGPKAIHAPQSMLPLPPMTVRLDEVQLFQFAAVTWNAHRIHYDDAYARAEGYRAPVAQMHLHGSLMLQLAQRWSGPAWSVQRYRYRISHPAYIGDTLTIGGELIDIAQYGRHETMSLRLYIVEPTGERISIAEAWLVRDGYEVAGV